MTEDRNKAISRRDFLKQSLRNIAAVGVAVNSSKESLFRIKKPDYFEVNNESPITLLQGNSANSVELWINYFGIDNKIKIRIESGSAKFVPFTPGSEQTRAVGEIIEPKLFKLEVNRELISEEYNVGVYPTPNGNLVNSVGRKEFAENSEMYGIPVIVGPCNYFPGTKPPLEKNKYPPAEDWMDLNEFGKGYFVGTVQKTNGENEFIASGYVCDSRALIEK